MFSSVVYSFAVFRCLFHCDKGRLTFRQYIPNKTHRYGVKLFKLCSLAGYTWSVKVYSGKSSAGEREIGLAKTVCKELMKDLVDQGRTLYVDNFYSSYDLAQYCQEKKLILSALSVLTKSTYQKRC